MPDTRESSVPLDQQRSGPALAWTTCTVVAKNTLRRCLIKLSPIGYEILFTPGNLDESPLAVIAGHREIVRLMKHPHLKALTVDHPPVVYRAYRRYLATSFTKKHRRAILKHHYAYLTGRISEVFFGDLLRNHPPVWQKTIGPDVFTIRLSFTGELHHEGDFLLEFQENGTALYHISFTIAPGNLTGSLAEHVLLVGRVQGVAGLFEMIRRATKKCLDITPPYLLMAAVEGIAAALEVDVIAGVKNSEQITVNSDEHQSVLFDYDVFWRAHQGTEAQKFYLMPVPITEKPLALISASHRRRTRSKRQFKSEVAESAQSAFGRFFMLWPDKREGEHLEPDHDTLPAGAVTVREAQKPGCL